MAKMKTTTKATKTKTAKTKTKSAGASRAKLKKVSDVPTYKIGEGDKAPAFAVPSTTGQTKSLADFKGKKLVLYFYPKDNTPGCTLEGQDFKRLHARFTKAGALVVGISRDSLRSHESFRAKCGFPFELLSDEDGALCKSFDVIQMKSLYGRKFEGIERSTFLIAEGRIAKAWRKVKVDGHAEEVLKAVETLNKSLSETLNKSLDK